MTTSSFKADGIDAWFDVTVLEEVGDRLRVTVTARIDRHRDAALVQETSVTLNWTISGGDDRSLAFHIDPLWADIASCVALCLGKTVGAKILECIWACRKKKNKLACIKDCLVKGLPGAVLGSADCIVDCFT